MQENTDQKTTYLDTFYAVHFLATISKEEVKIVMRSSKSLLLSNTSVWIKREEKPDFDVTMCRFDPVEICELGLKILVDHKLKR